MQEGGSIPSSRRMNAIDVQIIEEEKQGNRESIDRPQAKTAGSKAEELKGAYAAIENEYPTEVKP